MSQQITGRKLREMYAEIAQRQEAACPCQDAHGCDCCDSVPIPPDVEEKRPAKLIDMDELKQYQPNRHYLTGEEDALIDSLGEDVLEVVDQNLVHEQNSFADLLDDFGPDTVRRMALVRASELIDDYMV